MFKNHTKNRMGIINPDVYVTNQGIEKKNTYISFYNHAVNMRKNGIDPSSLNVYEVSSVANIWWDQPARESSKNTLVSVYVSTQLSSDAIGQNLYTILYARLKVMFPNAYDAPETVAVAPETVAVAPETVADAPVAPETVADAA